MSNPTAAMLVIGDEILSGRTRDANANHLAVQLTQKGINLKEIRVVSDDQRAIVDAIDALRHSFDMVFTSGGIGPTHDDITADCIAAAFDCHIDIRPDAAAILQRYYDAQGLEFNAARQRMARIPDGATLIENPISHAPGFSLGNVHVMAGVPKIFNAMLESVLPQITGGAVLKSETVEVAKGEGEIAALLADIAQNHPDVSIGSYPYNKDGKLGVNIVLRSTDMGQLAKAQKDVIKTFHV